MNRCSIFFLLGVLGNLATCLVIIKNEYMRTTTNIYLFNLALADLGTLVLAMPAELYLMWRQYPWTFGEVPTSKYTKLFVGHTQQTIKSTNNAKCPYTENIGLKRCFPSHQL